MPKEIKNQKRPPEVTDEFTIFSEVVTGIDMIIREVEGKAKERGRNKFSDDSFAPEPESKPTEKIDERVH